MTLVIRMAIKHKKPLDFLIQHTVSWSSHEMEVTMGTKGRKNVKKSKQVKTKGTTAPEPKKK